MDIDHSEEFDAKRRRRAPRRWFSDTLAMLVMIDVMAFTAAAWLVLQVPEGFESAASSANPVAVFARATPALGERAGSDASPGAVGPPTF